jgi:AbrB family looped-hinge helix DNA binding protein
LTFRATITSKGQLTIPAELRSQLKLDQGDMVEFVLDRAGRVWMHPLREGVEEVLSALPPRKPNTAFATDDDAIAAAVAARDARSRPKKKQLAT